jgi:hypothetical protein
MADLERALRPFEGLFVRSESREQEMNWSTIHG